MSALSNVAMNPFFSFSNSFQAAARSSSVRFSSVLFLGEKTKDEHQVTKYVFTLYIRIMFRYSAYLILQQRIVVVILPDEFRPLLYQLSE